MFCRLPIGRRLRREELGKYDVLPRKASTQSYCIIPVGVSLFLVVSKITFAPGA